MVHVETGQRAEQPGVAGIGKAHEAEMFHGGRQ
jgi:hypothetical protein